jgi:hypothetical protein
MHPHRCPTEVELFGDGHEIGELADFHERPVVAAGFSEMQSQLRSENTYLCIE